MVGLTVQFFASLSAIEKVTFWAIAAERWARM
jgi:hypothetical protein